jgi:hypothetical protein
MPWSLPWAYPEYTRQNFNGAARRLVPLYIIGDTPHYVVGDHISTEELTRLFRLIDNWRSSHSYPLNIFQAGLRTRAKQVDERAVVAQRLKRFPSILAKLKRFPDMRLTQIQDIAGCRAIVSSVPHAYALVKAYKESDIKHKLVHEDDYIDVPKESGYRSYHLVYRYNSDKKSKRWNGLKVEVQIRSILQHAWATAVETVGIFIRNALKSSQGDIEWLRFFQLMGTAIALRERGTPVPNTPSNRIQLKQELQDCARNLDVENRLRVFSTSLKTVEEVGVRRGSYFLLELDVLEQRTKITSYSSTDWEKAQEDYSKAERTGKSQDVVLVSAENIKALKSAYPNYFLDMRKFISAVAQAVSPMRVRVLPQQPTLFDKLE